MLLLVKDAWESKGGRWDEDVGPRRAPRGCMAQRPCVRAILNRGGLH